MAKKRISMREVRELLRLHFEQNISARKASQIVGIGKTSASQYIAGFKSSGLEYLSISSLSDTELLQAINAQKETENIRFHELSNQFKYLEKELKRVGVTGKSRLKIII